MGEVLHPVAKGRLAQLPLWSQLSRAYVSPEQPAWNAAGIDIVSSKQQEDDSNCGTVDWSR